MHDRNTKKWIDPAAVNPGIRIVNYQEPQGREQSWGPRRIQDFEMILCIRGVFEFVNHDNGETVVHNTGEVLTIRPGELHTYRVWKGSAFFSCIHLEPDRRGSYGNGDYETELPPRIRAFPPEHEIHELFRRMNYLFRHPARYSMEQLSCLGKTIWLYLFEAPGNTQSSLRFRAMLDYLNKNLLDHPTRLDLSRVFNVTPQRINAIFKREIQCSPGDYVHRELAVRAYNMLHDEQLSVKETAEALGFDNPFYFSRVFRKVFGFPPSAV